MINVSEEKNYKLSYEQTYKIVSNSIDIANENGFLNSANFQRCLYMFAATCLYENLERDIILENPLRAWDTMIADGSIEKLIDEFPHELEFLASVGEQWFKEYESYLHSIRGAFGDVQNFMKDMNDNLVSKFDEDSKENILNVLNIANEWGLDKAVNALVDDGK